MQKLSSGGASQKKDRQGGPLPLPQRRVRQVRARLDNGEVYLPRENEHRRQYDRAAGYIHPCCAFLCSD